MIPLLEKWTGGANQPGQARDTQHPPSSTQPLTVGKEAGKTKGVTKIKVQTSCLPLPPVPELQNLAFCQCWGGVAPEGTSLDIVRYADTPQKETPGGRHTLTATLHTPTMELSFFIEML